MNRFITSVVCGLVGFSTVVQADPSRPRLVVGIVVDQLRTDYMEFLMSRFGKDGFRLLADGGLYLKNVDFNMSDLDVVNSTAVIYTGNYPSASGIPSAKVYDPASKYPLPVLHDVDMLGNFTSETYSPTALRLSTISDEVAIDGVGLAQIYSVAPDAMQSIIMAGHAASGAAWIADESGKWATTTYYKEVPPALSQRNYKGSLAERLDTMVWTPSRPLDTYMGLPPQKKYFPFRHSFAKKDDDRFVKFKSTALVNAEVTDLALDYLRTLDIGQHGDVIDMLNIGYTVAPFKDAADGDVRLELQDSYLRLDSQLSRLFSAIQEYVGLENTLIFLSSTGYYDDAIVDDARYRIPTGNFSMRRATSLLNSYLSARHGNDQYVDGSFRNMIYLDHKTLENHGLDVAEVRRDARDFLVKMAGVSDVKSLTDIIGETTPELRRISRGLDPKSAGDLRLEFAPGWTINDDVRLPVLKWQECMARHASPAFIWGCGIAPRTVATPVPATAIAPTVTSVMRIRSPNGASESPLLP
ncbi:MAG: alkaline phosphatase family protein [Muribaculaceae bacterium]|nr:alkaline phosphatase family protein [Muribaculaceae bacterium]